MSLELSKAVDKLEVSSTMKMLASISKLKEAKKTIIPFNIGEPDFSTAQAINDEIITALLSGKTKYVDSSGIKELREVISNKLLVDNKLNYTPHQIVVTNGAKQALFEAIAVLLNEGDEVIIPTPCWVSYEEMVKINGGKCVFVATKADYQLDLAAIKAAITAKTKLIIINSPNNPTGCVYPKESLMALADLAIKHQFYIISDEVYEKLVYDDTEIISIASLNDAVYQQTITINGFSKAYAMTGLRLGYLAAPLKIADTIKSLQTHLTSNVCTPIQYAGIVALEKEKEFINKMVSTFAQRRQVTKECLAKIPHIKYNMGQGAFYVMVDVSYYLKLNPKIKTTDDLSLYLLENGGIAMMSGIDFKAKDCLRISYSTSIENIQTGLNIFKELLLKLTE